MWALWPIDSVQGAAQLQISHYKDGMHWQEGCSTLRFVGGYLSGTLESGWMGDNLEFFGEVLGIFMEFYLFYYYIGHIHEWRSILSVHTVEINGCDACSWERHSRHDRTPSFAVM